jgi:LPXTG-motif cell wall-anchored protein
MTSSSGGNNTGYAGAGRTGATRAKTPSYIIWIIVGAIVLIVAGFLLYRRRRMKLLLDSDKNKDKSKKK